MHIKFPIFHRSSVCRTGMSRVSPDPLVYDDFPHYIKALSYSKLDFFLWSFLYISHDNPMKFHDFP